MKKILMGLVMVCLLLTLTGCGCKHEETKLINEKAATCVTDGYTGDTVCVKCGEALVQGQVISAKGHILSEPNGAREATCSNEGYTGDIYCTVCSEKVVTGEVIPATEHMPSESSVAREATCERDGYTSEIYCLICYKTLTESEVIPALGHTLGEPVNVVEATCQQDGYTGDRVCSVCEDTIKGEVIPKLEHDYDENHVCTFCGWMEPGLYIDGKLQFNWEEMIANNYVTVDTRRNCLTGVTKSLYGHLVVEEGIVLYDSGLFRESALNSVYLPASVTEIPYSCFADCPALESVRVFGQLERVRDGAFENCASLKEFVADGGYSDLGERCFQNCTSLTDIALPEGLMYIRNDCFAHTSLSEVTLPSTLKYIQNRAFANCADMTHLELPESVENIGDNFVLGTGISELVVPAGVTNFGCQRDSFFVSIDMSKSAVTKIEGAAFENDTLLESIVLPEGLQRLSDSAFIGCAQLKRLELPASLVDIYDDWGGDFSSCTSLTTVVWPASLNDGTLLTSLPNLKNILYTGSQLQWDLTVSKDLFLDKTVVVDYVPEG